MADKIKINSDKKQKSQAATLKKVIRDLEDTEFFSYFQFCLQLYLLRLHFIFQS